MGPLETAQEAWGDAMPDWVRVLALACTRASQAKVAKQLDRSGAVISQVLRNIYPAQTTGIEERVRGVFMDGVVECPAEGAMPAHTCQDWRGKARSFVVGNPRRTTMYRACRTCPRFLKEGEE